jgi:hypothetical protein
MSVALIQTALKAWSIGVKAQAWTSPENNAGGASPQGFRVVVGKAGRAEN